MLHAPRVGLFSANREGILSCAGYMGLNLGKHNFCANHFMNSEVYIGLELVSALF